MRSQMTRTLREEDREHALGIAQIAGGDHVENTVSGERFDENGLVIFEILADVGQA